MSLPLDLPRLSRGRSGSVASGSASAWPMSAGWLFLLFFSTGLSASPAGALLVPDPLPALSLLESFLCSVGRSESEAALELVLVEAGLPVLGLELPLPVPGLELALPVLGFELPLSAPGLELVLPALGLELALPVPGLALVPLVLSLELFLCSVGRSGSLACACPPESAPVPELLPEPPPLPVPPAGASPA